MSLETHGGVRLEVATREMSGPLLPGRRPSRLASYVFTLPAILLVGLILIAPIGWTVIQAFWTPSGVGLGNFAAVFDEQALWTYLRTFVWVLIALGLVCVALGLALLTRKRARLWTALLLFLVVPFALPPLVSGAAFRMIFDPTPEHGTATALTGLFGWYPAWLGSGWIWFVLVSAFVWTWLGFAVSLFRAGLDAIDNDPVEKAHVEAAGSFVERLRRRWPTLQPVFFIVLVTVVVAAARIFDLVLIAVPGSMQYDVDVVGVQWWRLTISGDQGGPAALALPMAVVLAIVVPWIMSGVRRAHPRPVRRSTPKPAGKGGRLVGSLLTALWAVPLVVLLATAFHSPDDARAVHWWQLGPSGPGWESFRQVWHAGLGDSVRATAVVATLVTVLVVGAAVPMAYLLSSRWGARRRGRMLVVALTVLAVMPVQMYVLALRGWFADLGLAGSRIPLILVHAATGLPFAILVLRAALVTAPPHRATDTLSGLTRPLEALRRIWDRAGHALIAVSVLEFVQVWNDFVLSFLVSGPGSSPLTLVLWGEARQFGNSFGTIAASAVVMIIVPVALLLATWRRYVVPGLTGGVLR